MHSLFWSPVETDAYNNIVAAHKARFDVRYFAPENHIQDPYTEH